MNLRILFATHAPANRRTAVYRSVAAQAAHLASAGHHVDILTRDDVGRAGWERLDPLLLPLRLARRDLSAYDVLVFHSYLGWAFHLLRRWCDPRHHAATVTWFHGLEPLYHQAVADEYRRTNRRLSRRFRWLHHGIVPRLLARTCRRSDAVFCFNSVEADYLARQQWAEAPRIHRVSNGVEAACFVPRQYRPLARRLLFVGQWLPGKGTRYLVRAFTSLSALRELELACVGTGASEDVVRAAFPAAVRPHVSVFPHVDRDGLYDQLRQADLFLFPTLSEGFSCALLEAMAAALPVIATPVGAAVDLLEDGRNGVLVPCADARAIAAAVMPLLDDVRRRETLGSAARRTAARFLEPAPCAVFADRLMAVAGRDDVRRRRAKEVRSDAA